MTTIAAVTAELDKVQAALEQSDESIVALVIENSKLRRQVADLEGRVADLHARLAAKAIW